MLKGIAEVGVQKGLDECQKLFENETWTCPEEMYKKLPIVGNTALPFGESVGFVLQYLLYVKRMINNLT